MKKFPEADLGHYLPAILIPLHNYAVDNGFHVFLAGGCVRDAVHDQIYRDIDVCVVGNYLTHSQALADIVEALPGRYEIDKVYDRDSQCSYTEEFPEGEERYHEIVQFKSEMQLPPIDLLFHVEPLSDAWKVTGRQDHSINQFAAWVGSNGLVVAYLGDELLYGDCRPLRQGLTEERVEHVRGIAGRLGWTFTTREDVENRAAQAEAKLKSDMDDLDQFLEDLV